MTKANVTVRDPGRGFERTSATNEYGLYVFPNLVPGPYEIQVDAAKFASARVSSLMLTAGERREVNVALTIRPAGEKITIRSSQIADVQLASSSLVGLVDSHSIVELPLNGRDWTALTLLEPGVAPIVTQKPLAVGSDRANRGLGMDVSIQGNRPQANVYRLDGIVINDYSSGAPAGVSGNVLGVDAVREFSVITSNAAAGYGRAGGGVINAASRSGTNSLHGSAYEFLRNNDVDARNFFDRATVPPFQRNQFGASAGGPLIRDRTFFFANYEGLRQNLDSTNTIRVPSAQARTGQLAGGNVTVDPLVAPFLSCSPSSCLFPLPNGPVSGDTGIYNLVGKQATSDDMVTARLDHRISAWDSVFGTYVWGRGQVSTPDAYNFKTIGNESGRHTLALEESHFLSPALLTTARFGFNRNVVDAARSLDPINPAAADPAFGFNPGKNVGLLTLGSGITQFPGGLGALAEYRYHYNSFQFYNDWSWSRSQHFLSFGFAAERIQSNQFTSGATPSGSYKFDSLQSFLTNRPTSYSSLLTASNTPRDLRQWLLAGYFQDDYRLRTRLTLNLGLRYETITVPTETANQLSTLTAFTDSTPRLGSPYFSNSTRRNFAPRFGFAWDPAGNGKTAVRGAFGIYDVLPLPYQFELLTLLSAPFTEAGSSSFPGSGPRACNSPGISCFPRGGFPNLTAGTLRFGYVEQKPHRNYVEQWNVNLQRELFPNFTATAAYVGSHGVHLPFHADDVNDFQPAEHIPEGYLWPIVTGSGSRQFPNIGGQVTANTWSADSIYHGLELGAVKRLSRSFQLQGAYTFSKSIDTSSSGIAGDTFGNSVSSLPFFDPRLRRGLSDFDVRHVAVFNGTWNIRYPTSWRRPGRWATSGWQVSGILTLTSGLPFTPTIAGDPLGLQSADNYAFPDRVPGCNPVNSNFKADNLYYLNLNCFALPAQTPDIMGRCRTFGSIAGTCANLMGNSGRNTVVGPGLRDFDFALFKTMLISRKRDTINAQFRWEIFNLWNHANFNAPPPAALQIYTAAGLPNTSTAGVLAAPTANTARQMQFALKLIW